MLKIVKDSVLKVSRSFGYDIVPLREMKERDFALHLGALLEQLKIDCVLDVGANVGQYHDFLRNKVLYEGPIVSFEPVSRHVALLRERAQADDDWHVEGYALGAKDGNLPINVMVSDQFSSFLQPDNSRVRDYDGLNVPQHVENVTVRTLDVVMPVLQERLGFERPYLKLDTQGFDIEVLQGAGDSLPLVRALQTEASVIGIYKGMPGYMDTIRYLNERGFDITGLYPVSRDSALRLVEFDCVMINRDAA
ncbi:methyltransferase, FkbM family [Enhydrobacter aerosaccus]|uniref:Methyltransferase, FkbM family n=1 Tax=Enhydrobacter aerosaccus TaxID=225324 RepID=A0A1T4TC47_9HYPH|nr:FkbM family methyltransferase [Enhydrobacter aerosaccus]SKA37901.1 methyltransferase, FkbM family [Enhydrobacter aerosaccus]